MAQSTNHDFAAITKATLADDLAQRVNSMIQSGSYEPGDRLPTINEMARGFGVGHTTLREALRKLEALGVITIRHGSGVYVEKNYDTLLMTNPVYLGTVSKKLMLDLIDARVPIEVRSAVLAAEHRTAEHISRMETLLANAGEQLHNDAVLTRTNMSFHRQVAVASKNAVLTQMLEVLANLFDKEQRTILNIHGHRERDHEEHLGILEALRKRDAQEAERLMRLHLEGVRTALLKWDPEEHPLE